MHTEKNRWPEGSEDDFGGKKRKLDAIDFMMMDVHRPLTEEEIDEINPQAVVDRSNVVGLDTPGVDEPQAKEYPHEQSLPDNVTILPIGTTHDLSPVEVLRNAVDVGLVELVVVGIDEQGREYLLRTNADPAIALWHLHRGQYLLQLEQDSKRLEAYKGEDS